LRHLLLIGEYDLGIDDKNRLSLPADIRKLINSDRDGDAFFLVLGRNGKPWLYPEKYYEQIVFQEEPEITPEEEQLDFDHMNFALADRITWDSQGRMLIPEKTMRRTGLGKEITLIGSRDHLELWDRAEWQVRREGLLARRTEIAVRAKKIRKNPSEGSNGNGPQGPAGPAGDQG
jgi:transcriptional regulator MraZ